MKYLALISLLLLVAGVYSEQQLATVNDITSKLETYTGLTLNYQQWNGYIPVANEDNTSLFFSLSTKQGETISKMSSDTPVIFWFNGGPGCSSQFGNWLEIGPLDVQKSGNSFEFANRKYSWNKHALLVFTDQPLNAGLSYGANVSVSDTNQASDYFKQFVKGFYGLFDNLKGNPTYFFGESYAGHYIPRFASMIVNDKPVDGLNFQGIGIGDGFTNPELQLQSYADYTYNAAVASEETRQQIKGLQKQAVQDIQAGRYSAATKLFDDMTGNKFNYGEIDIYNIFYYDLPGQRDPQVNDGGFTSLLNDADFRKIWGVPSIIPQFSNCNDDIYNAFSDDITRSYQHYVEELIEDGVNVLLFNGQLDLIVNSPGAQDWIDTMEWSDSAKWQKASRKVWYKTGSKSHVIGNYQHHSNFVYANIYLAGHMVPSDQPEAADQMLQNYLSWHW